MLSLFAVGQPRFQPLLAGRSTFFKVFGDQPKLRIKSDPRSRSAYRGCYQGRWINLGTYQRCFVFFMNLLQSHSRKPGATFDLFGFVSRAFGLFVSVEGCYFIGNTLRTYLPGCGLVLLKTCLRQTSGVEMGAS